MSLVKFGERIISSLPADGETLPHAQIHVVTHMNRESKIFLNLKKKTQAANNNTKPIGTPSYSFNTAAVLVVALS